MIECNLEKVVAKDFQGMMNTQFVSMIFGLLGKIFYYIGARFQWKEGMIRCVSLAVSLAVAIFNHDFPELKHVFLQLGVHKFRNCLTS